MKKEERLNRIIARGEFSNHSHIITGNCTIERIGEDIFINAEDGQAVMKHLLETDWLKGNEVWTKEHTDIPLTGVPVRHGDILLKPVSKGRYQFIQATEFDPFEKIIRQVRD